jgi:hypothetical protein
MIEAAKYNNCGSGHRPESMATDVSEFTLDVQHRDNSAINGMTNFNKSAIATGVTAC